MCKRKLGKTLILWSSLLLVFSFAVCSPQPITSPEPQQDTQKAAEFEVGPITFEPATVMVGDSVIATATLRNIGDIAGTYAATFTIDGQEMEKKDIVIEPQNNREASFQFSKTSPGTYNLAIGTSSTAMTVHEWKPYRIQYDHYDDVEKVVRSCVYISGENGHTVRFTPTTKPFMIQKIIIGAWVNFMFNQDLDNYHITVRIWDKDGNNQLWSQDFPWRSFMDSGNEVVIPSGEVVVPNIRVNDDFQVEVVTHSTPSSLIPDTEIPRVVGPAIGTPSGGAGGMFGSGRKWPQRVVCIGYEYSNIYTTSPGLKRPETRSGYSYMGKPIDTIEGETIPGRYKGINWLIRVEGEGVAGN